MIKAPQIRAARALLNLSREELAKLSGVSAATIHNIENELHATNATTLDKLEVAFANAGIIFIGQTGVELNTKIVKLFYGQSGLEDFFNDVYRSISDNQKHTIRITGVDESKFMQSLSKDFTSQHIQRMLGLKNVEVRVLTNARYDHIRLQYVSYKHMPEPYFSLIPSYNYANKLAYVMWEPLQVVLIEHPKLAEAGVKQFDFIWDTIQQ